MYGWTESTRKLQRHFQRTQNAQCCVPLHSRSPKLQAVISGQQRHNNNNIHQLNTRNASNFKLSSHHLWKKILVQGGRVLQLATWNNNNQTLRESTDWMPAGDPSTQNGNSTTPDLSLLLALTRFS